MNQISDELWKAMGGYIPTKEDIESMSDPIKEYKQPNLIKTVNGWVRLWVWGVCPECNHDAPKLYNCGICNYYKELPKYRSGQTNKMKNKVWGDFLRGVENES